MVYRIAQENLKKGYATQNLSLSLLRRGIKVRTGTGFDFSRSGEKLTRSPTS